VAAQTTETLPTTDQADPADAELRWAVEVYVAQRPRLLRIAQRILGGAAEADDVVQEVWVRWQRTDRSRVQNPAAFLATSAGRLAINVRQAARSRHETASTPWLAEAADETAPRAGGPEVAAERAEAAEVAMRVLLERLNAPERAAYVLRNGFGYPYLRIAQVLHLSAANSRQLVSRAHGRLHSPRRQPVSPEAHRRLVRAFESAARTGALPELEALLAADVAQHHHR
jgi:RNA polymerase sigma-70 factor (ECF subfamily)